MTVPYRRWVPSRPALVPNPPYSPLRRPDPGLGKSHQSLARFLSSLIQGRLNFKNLKLNLLDFLESGHLARVDHVDQAEEEHEGACDLKPMNRACTQMPGLVWCPEEPQDNCNGYDQVRHDLSQ